MAVVLGLLCAFLVAAGVVLTAVFRIAHRWGGAVAVALLAGVLVATPVLAWKRYAVQHALRHVPAPLLVKSIAFEATVASGFGPGGAEEGLLLYPLPDAAARAVADGGVPWLDAMEPFAQHRNNLGFSDWQPTPADGRGLPVESMLCAGDDCADVPGSLQARVNAILARPGSYFARGRPGGTIVVSPRDRLVIIRYGK